MATPTPFRWDDIRFFLAVARSRTISLAGSRLGTDHATVGRRITKLERSLGVKLFERNPRGYVLTPHGDALLDKAASMEAHAVRITEETAFEQSGITGSVRLSTPEGFGNFFLAKRIGQLSRSHPHLSLKMTSIQQIVALSQREADIAVSLAVPTSGNYRHEHLIDYRLSVYGSREYLKAAAPIRDRREMSEYPFVGYVDDLVFTRSLDYLSEIAPSLRARVQNSSLHAQLVATIGGAGLCVLPDYVASTVPELEAVLPHEVNLTRSYWMIAHEDLAETAPVRLMRRFLREIVAEAGDFFFDQVAS